MKRLLAVASLASMMLSGCAWTWPKEGTGGMAERPVPNNSYETLLLNKNAPLSRTKEHEIWTTRLVVAKQRYDQLIVEGGKMHFPAITQDIALLYARTAREFQGGLREDAINGVIRLESMLGALENRLTALGQHGVARSQTMPEAKPGLQRVIGTANSKHSAVQ